MWWRVRKVPSRAVSSSPRPSPPDRIFCRIPFTTIWPSAQEAMESMRWRRREWRSSERRDASVGHRAGSPASAVRIRKTRHPDCAPGSFDGRNSNMARAEAGGGQLPMPNFEISSRVPDLAGGQQQAFAAGHRTYDRWRIKA